MSVGWPLNGLCFSATEHRWSLSLSPRPILTPAAPTRALCQETLPMRRSHEAKRPATEPAPTAVAASLPGSTGSARVLAVRLDSWPRWWTPELVLRSGRQCLPIREKNDRHTAARIGAGFQVNPTGSVADDHREAQSAIKKSVRSLGCHCRIWSRNCKSCRREEPNSNNTQSASD